MSASAPQASRNTASVGHTTRLVTVRSVSADGIMAICTDGPNSEVRVPVLWQRSKGVLPQAGERWIITQDVTNSWSFALFMGSSASSFPQLPGPWQSVTSGFPAGVTGRFSYRADGTGAVQLDVSWTVPPSAPIGGGTYMNVTLPAALAPREQKLWIIHGLAAGNWAPLSMDVDAAGKVHTQFTGNSSLTALVGCASYPLGV